MDRSIDRSIGATVLPSIDVPLKSRDLCLHPLLGFLLLLLRHNDSTFVFSTSLVGFLGELVSVWPLKGAADVPKWLSKPAALHIHWQLDWLNWTRRCCEYYFNSFDPTSVRLCVGHFALRARLCAALIRCVTRRAGPVVCFAGGVTEG